MKALVIDITKCNGCHNCQIACKDEHVANDWSPYAKPQPDTGQFWTKVTDIVRGTVPKVKVTYQHDICQHCDDAPCVAQRERQAIYKRDDGIVIIDPDQCRGRRNCVDACPYGDIYFNSDLNIAQKCTMCAHILDGEGGSEVPKVPRCVDICPTGTRTFGEEEDLKDLIDQAEILKPETNAKPRVYYIGLPKRFVAGAVYDPEEDECLEGATVTLTGEHGNKSTVETDYFGDFWLKDLELGTYSLFIEKDGYHSQEIRDINTEKDINVGDIKLYLKT